MKLNRFLLSGMLAVGLALGPDVSGSEPLANAVFSIGTTTTNAQGAQWAYLLWQPTEANALAGKKIAVYSKLGDAASGNTYARKTITQRHTDPLIIKALLDRALNLGDDTNQLNARINALFSAAVPRANLKLEEKISAVIRGSESDPQMLANVIFLGRLHPSLNMALGHAWAEPIAAGKTTFEVRDYNVNDNKDLGVIGRVTVEAGNPIILPAPGMPVQYDEPSAMGDLNIKLRWATPDALREVGLLQHGYNLYRIPRALAEAANYHVNPPLRQDLPGLVGNGIARRVNGTPITVNKLHDGLSALNFDADPTWYIADDNERHKPNGVAFVNGEEFYYFVTARDLLGRDGIVSIGGLAMACDRLPPDAPEGVKVENHYTYDPGTQTSNQVLKVSWKQAPPNTGDVVTAYYVYRWTNATIASQVGQTNATINRIAGPIAYAQGQLYNSYIDNGPGSPHAPDDYNKTWWYTVRAADAGVCTNNLSPNSAPAFGVLRDRKAPGEPTGEINILCCRPWARSDKDMRVTGQSADTNLAYYRFVVSRTNQGLAYAEFYFTAGGQTNVIGRADFPAGLDPLVFDWNTNRVLAGGGLHRTFVRVVSKDDKKTGLIEGSNDQLPAINSIHQVQWFAYLDCRRLPRRPGTPGGNDDCGDHTPNNPDTGEVEGPIIVFQPPVTSKEFRLYRRVNFGPMTLIKQGPITEDPPDPVTYEDPHPPANAAFICYYVQLLDEHGNAGPMTQIDDCFKFKLPNPKPLLSPLKPENTEDSPQMRISWFCPPWGVERFEVYIYAQGGSPMPDDIGGGLVKADTLQPTNKWVTLGQVGFPVLRPFYVYRTPRVGPQFGQGGLFQTIVNIELNKTYHVFIKPIGLDGEPDPDSSNSKVEKLTWSVPVVEGPKVPWPARDLPNVNSNGFPTWVRPIMINNPNVTSNFIGVGIIVGVTDRAGRRRDTLGQPALIDGSDNPATWLASSSDGDPLFPCVVYRYQETNSFFPDKVSGDIVQVTPMMERIAHIVGPDQQFGTAARIYDPFIDVYGSSLLNIPEIPPASVGRNVLTLLDTQPVIIGAKYRYVIVRYGENREIAEVIPTEPITIQ